MYNLLMEKLRGYIQQNNPDLLHRLQSEFQWSTYLEDKVGQSTPLIMRLLSEGKPGHAIEELVMNELTKELRPSRFNYVKKVLQEEFAGAYNHFHEKGVVTFEVIRMVETGGDIFEAFSFSEETENDHRLRHTIIAHIYACLH